MNTKLCGRALCFLYILSYINITMQYQMLGNISAEHVLLRNSQTFFHLKNIARLRPLLYFSAAETPSHSELTAAASFSVAHRQRSPINSAARLLAHSRPPVTTSPPSFRNFTVAPCPTAIPLQSQTRSSIAPLMPSLPVTSAQDRAQDLGATAPSPTLAPPSGTVSTLKSDCIDLSIFKTLLQKPTSSKLMMLILYTVC